jgi:uncharacterized protein (TIGR01777 family)
MNILIAGASGFIGTTLVKALEENHQITVLGRTLEKLEQSFSKNINKLTWKDLNNHPAKQYDLVINLSGSNIGAKRWSSAIKKEIVESRTSTNEQLAEWLLREKTKPRFFCASAIGIYGAKNESDQVFDEDSPLPLTANDFLQNIGLLWEKSLETLINAGIPVTPLRFGVVLKKGEGMLKKLAFSFECGLGSILGNGQQTLSWIHYKDLVNAFNFLIEHPNVNGPINITAPFPISQQTFAREFAKVLKRPIFLKMPDWFIQGLLGELGEYLLLKGQKVIPKRLTELGFKFTYPTITSALEKEYQ